MSITQIKAHDHYYRLIELSDLAFDKSGIVELGSLRTAWEFKAEAYRMAADMFLHFCTKQGVKMHPKQTKLDLFRQQEQAEELGSEIDELHYHETM